VRFRMVAGRTRGTDLVETAFKFRPPADHLSEACQPE
jgi:hypothetical protein